MAELTMRQQEIMEIAIKLMARRGIQQVTMKNIAKQLGISEPAIYRHFESKMAILLAILAQFKEHSRAHLTRARSLESSGILRLETIFLEHAGQFVKHPHTAVVVFSEELFQNDLRLAEEVFAMMTLAQETVAEIIGEAQINGEIRPDLPQDHLALMILGTLRLLVKRWHLSHYAFDLQQESARVWESLKTLFTYKDNS
jgi:TetR/AcrR family fatty acid metabolism transcriptional regulator